MYTLYVSKEINSESSTGNHFSTITAALDQIPDDNKEFITIRIAPGCYEEKLVINKPYLKLIGNAAKDTIITYGDYANYIMPDGKKRGTFRSYTVLIDTHDVIMENITIENASQPRTMAGQAIALYADGDHLVFRSCRLMGNQDTLFTGPLPPAPLEPDGFTGPKEFSPRINGRQLYESCYICGDIDFIFGSATAYFHTCQIESLNNGIVSYDNFNNPIYGFITAASTPEGQNYGYIFDNCRFTSKNCPAGSIYLGRP